MAKPSVRWPAHYPVVALLCAAVFISYIDRTNISVGVIAIQSQMGWNETQKGMVLSSFFIGYILMMLGAATLANRYGGRIVLGVAVVWWSAFTALTPPAALSSLSLLILARIALGLGEAAVFPASFNVIANVVPATQRSRVVALFSSCLHLGTVFALPVTASLARRYGWPTPFYLFAAVGLVWAVAWFTGVRVARPTESGTKRSTAIPWRGLLRSRAVWAIVVAHFCSNWSLYVLLAWLPSYFKSTFGLGLVNAGAMSAAPWLVAFAMANVAGHIADRLLIAGYSATIVRKLLQTVALGGVTIFLLALPSAHSVAAALAIVCCATGSGSFSIAAFPPNCFDVAPRHADVIYGISNTFATLPGIFGVFVTGWLVDRTGSFTAPLMLAAGVAFVGAIFYVMFGSGERQFD